MRTHTIIDALFYLVTKLNGFADRLQLVKLMYLADKYHLIKYGDTISGDKFYAMRCGPVGSGTLNVLHRDISSPVYLSCFNELFEYLNSTTIRAKKPISEVRLDWLSETHKAALDTVLSGFSSMDSMDIMNYTHGYPEWAKHESKIRAGAKRFDIKPEELVSLNLSATEKLPLKKEDIEDAATLIKDRYRV